MMVAMTEERNVNICAGPSSLSSPDNCDVNDAECEEGHSNNKRSVVEPRARPENSHADLLYWEGEVGGEVTDEDGVPGHQDDQQPGQVGDVEHLFLL